MALNLEELKFVVNTEDLDTAAKKINALGDAIVKVNKPLKESAMDSEKLAQAQAKTAEAAAKAELATTKAALAAEKLSKATDSASDSGKTQMSILEKQQSILDFMTQGYTKGQSTILAYTKASGEATSEVAKILDAQRQLAGGDPFDKSLSGIKSLRNELKVLEEVQRLYGQGVELTGKQVRDLALDKERLIMRMRQEGASIMEIQTALSSMKAEYIAVAGQVNAVSSAEREMIKTRNDAAKATRYLEETDARLAAALDETNKHLDKASSDAWVKYQRAVSTAGLAADEASAKLAHAKTQFDAIADKKQADKLAYLSRAISVQMGDVGISLASGMNPLLVMIQQGDQIRGAIQQAGASGKELEKAMSNAAGQIATSFMQTAQAIGGFFVNAVTSAGKALVEVPWNLGAAGLATLMGNSEATTAALDRLKIAAIGLSKVGIIALISAIAFMAVSTIDAIKEYRNLTTVLTTSGASMGLTTQQAMDQVKAMKDLGASHGEAITVITEMAKTGKFTADNIDMVTRAATGLNKYGGVAIEDTVKMFAKVADDPVKALIEYGKQTGNVNAEQIKHIKNLVDTDQKAKAVKEAMTLMGEGSAKSIQTMKDESGSLLRFWLETLEVIKAVKDALMGVGRTEFKPVDIEKTLIDIQKLEDAKQRGFVNTQLEKMNADALVIKYAQLEKQKRLATAQFERNQAPGVVAGVKKLETDLSNTPQHSSFNVPKDEGLANTLLAYKNAEKAIGDVSAKLLATNKASFALGLKDMDTYLSDELALITGENNQKITLNEEYTEKLNKAEKDQKAAINAAYGQRMGLANVKQRKDLQEELTREIDKTTESYNREREKIKASTAHITENTAKLREQAIAQVGVYTKKVIEGSKEFAKAEDEIIQKRQLQMDMEQATAGLYGRDLARIKATIEAEQRHIKTISDYEDALKRAKATADKFGTDGPQTEDVTQAQAAVLAAEIALGKAKEKARTSAAKAGADAEKSYLDDSTKRLNAYGQAFENMFSGMADAIINFAKTGKMNFNSLIDSMIADLIRFELKKQTMSMYENMGGAAGIFKMLGFGGGMTAQTNTLTGGTGNASGISYQAANGAAWDNGIKAFANGGAFTNSIVSEPTLFKFAKGTGLMGEAGPEAIMPLRRGADGSLGVVNNGGSSGNVSVQVINNSTSQATTNETVDSKGNRKIEVVIGDMTAGEISRNGSASQKSIRSTFGLQPQLIRR
jgi:lambda family phage tail tape measure protein